MLESTRVRSRILTPYFILPLGKASHSVTIEKPMIGKNNAVVLDAAKNPIMEKVASTVISNWGALFLKKMPNKAFFIHSIDELKLVAIDDDTPYLNIVTNQANETLDTVPFSIIDSLSQFLTEPDSIINNVNLATMVKSGFIDYDFQKSNVKELLSDYMKLNAITEIDDRTLDTLIARDNAQKMGIIHSNFQLHDQLPRLIADHSNSVNLATDNKAVTMEARSQTIDYLNTSSRTNDQNVKTVENTESLKSFDQGVATNGTKKKVNASAN